MNKPIRYEIYVEGGLHDTTPSLKSALRLREKYENEGWNIRIVAIYNTILGEMGHDI